MSAELAECFRSITLDDSVASVHLSAEGTRAFCAGADLKEQSTERATPDRASSESRSANARTSTSWKEALDAVKECPVPVVAAVNGPAIGGGFVLLGYCDVIFAAHTAWFSLPEVGLGLTAEPTTALRLLGPYKARSMLFSGNRITASELFQLGVIEAIVGDASVDERALTFAEKLAETDPKALRLAKASLIRAEKSDC